MGKCKIENCENYCDKSSEYICDICYEGYLAGRLSFREYSKIRKHREFDYPKKSKTRKKDFKLLVKEFNELSTELLSGLWMLVCFTLSAGIFFYTMFIMIGQVSGWIFEPLGAWYQSEPIQDFMNLDGWTMLAITYIRIFQILLPIMGIGRGLCLIIYSELLSGVIVGIIVIYIFFHISLIGYIYGNEIIEYLIYGN